MLGAAKTETATPEGFSSADTALYSFRTTRTSAVTREVLDAIRPDAPLVTDRYVGNNRLPFHCQFCYGHLKRDALDIARGFLRNAKC